MLIIGQIVPRYQQRTDYSCSAACLYAIVQFFGLRGWDEAALIRLVGARPDVGAPPEALVKAARKLGLSADFKRYASIEALRVDLRDGLVIANVKSFTRPVGGHYVVVVGVDATNVYLMDPNVAGNRRVLRRAEMDACWLKHSNRAGVVVRRK